VKELLSSLKRAALPQPWEHSGETLTDRTPVEVVTDAVRARLFEWLHAEVPYRITQETKSWREVPRQGSWEGGEAKEGAMEGGGEKAILIHQDLCVPSSGVQGMLLARGGEPVKMIALAAARDAGNVLGKKIFLQLHVKVGAPTNKD